MPISRPARHAFTRWLTGQLVRYAAVSVHDKNVFVAGGGRIENNLLPIGRPTWSSSRRVEVGELNDFTPIASAHPDFIGSATGRFESNLTSVRRELRTTLHPCRRYESVGRAGRNQ